MNIAGYSLHRGKDGYWRGIKRDGKQLICRYIGRYINRATEKLSRPEKYKNERGKKEFFDVIAHTNPS